MRAVVVHQHGGPEVLEIEERPTPEPGPGQVQVRVRAASLNHLDLWVRQGVEGHTFPLPLVLGSDGAGEVTALGVGVTGVEVGDRVAIAPGVSCGACIACDSGRDHQCRSYHILGETCDGTQAETVVVPADGLLPVPDGLGFEEAAAIPLPFLTAWNMLIGRAQLRPGETVLVLGGGSAVGSAAIQIARLWGARVVTTAGTDAKRQRCLELGAFAAVDHSDGFAHSARQHVGRAGFDVVFEHVGAATWEDSLRVLGRHGRLVTCGATTGHDVRLNLRHLFFKQLSILGSTMGSRGQLRELWGHVVRGDLRAVVDRCFPLDQVAEAHRHVADREQFGKVVLRL